MGSFLPVAKPATGKLSEYLTGQDSDFYLHVLLWTIILFFGLPVLRFLFGGIMPHAQRYSTTKLLRRFHGVTAELILLGTLFVLLTVISGLLMRSQHHEIKRRMEGKIREWQRSSETGVSSTSTEQDGEAARLLRQLHNNFASSENNDAVPNIDVGRPTIDRSQKPPTGIGKPPPTPPSAHAQKSREDAASAMRAASSSLPASMRPGGETYENALAEIRNDVAQQGPWRKYFLLPARNFWPVALFIACLLWLLAHAFFKADISSFHRLFMRFIEEGRFGQGGSGRFAGLFEEWGMISSYQDPGALVALVLTPFKKQHLGHRFGEWLAKKRRSPQVIRRTELFLGRSLYNPFLNLGIGGDQHMLTIAPSRTGKGATAIIPNLLLWEGSAIVIDPKGTNAAVTAERRRQMGQKVHLADPFGIVERDEEKRACFNPLAHLNPDSDTIREDIGVIADALVVPDPEAKEKHWDDGARTVLSGLIGQLITGYENPSLPLLRELLALPPEKQDELWASMFLNTGAGSAPRDTASRIIRGAGTNEISGLISNADKHTEWLSFTAIQKTLSRSTFSFAELKEQPTTIYLILPPHYLGLHNRFLRLFINMAILQMAVGGRSKIPVLMVLDEFLALGYMAEVEKALGLMAGYNFILWPIVQDLARLKDLYKNSFNSFIANSRAVQVFGVSDPETTEYISKQLGHSGASGEKFGSLIPLRSPDEVAKDIDRDSHRQYILRAGKAPLVLEKVPYHKGTLLGGHYPGLFHGKYAADPDHQK